jgi:hypothetical protein
MNVINFIKENDLKHAWFTLTDLIVDQCSHSTAIFIKQFYTKQTYLLYYKNK